MTEHQQPAPSPTISVGDINDLLRNLSYKAERYARAGQMVRHDVMVEAYNDVAFWTHRPLAPGSST